MASTSISVGGDRAFVNAVGMVARKHNMTTAQFVQAVLLKKHGKEIREALSFFVKDDAQIDQMMHSENEEEKQSA